MKIDPKIRAYTPRFIVKHSIDKEYKKCKFKVEDNWGHGKPYVEFCLPYPYEKSKLEGKIKEAKALLREDCDDMEAPLPVFLWRTIYKAFRV